MRKIYNSICKIESIFVQVCLCLVVALVFLSAIMRTIKMPINWALDVAQLCFAWSVFLGADLTIREGKLINVDFIEKRFPEKIRFALDIIIYTMIMLFLIVVGYYGIQLCIENYARTFQSLTLSYSWVTLSLPVGSFFMVITIILQLKEKLFSKKCKEVV